MLRSRSNTLKTNKSGVDMIFVLTVFVLFVCCLLAAVLAFAKAYKHFGSEIEKRFDTATAQTLVLQKLRSYDSGAVSAGKQGDTDYLGFSDTIDFTITCNGVQTSSHYCLRSGKEGAG